ncbi:HUWE1-associated protein modifying stress responses [Phlebotomus argentipes]|uniref:HUWE1-associated protein modifying stress responses n=1 Tax=Phlebotomus argentipes TaxID=94469 RepID=UPI002892F79B|nr:HUWE1-associated protein modifying stress responses [Phlebotomus argentipes]
MQSDSEESWIAAIENQYMEAIENQPDFETELIAERDAVIKHVWRSFQESATAVAQLYKDRSSGHDSGLLWLPFQTAAGTITTLYKDSTEGLRRIGDVAVQCGYQRRNKEIAAWAKKRRRNIRREDLLSYLAGKPPPPLHVSRASQMRSSPKPEQHINNHHNLMQHGATPFVSPQLPLATEPEMHTFKEALARRSRGPELYAFVTGEVARHCKRPASPSLDVNMESLGSKRQRFL